MMRMDLRWGEGWDGRLSAEKVAYELKRHLQYDMHLLRLTHHPRLTLIDYLNSTQGC